MKARRTPRLALLLSLSCASIATLSLAADFRSGDEIELRGTFSDNVFAAGGSVTADFDSIDDAFVAGGEIDFRGRTKENIFLAGGDLDLRAPQARLGVLAGGDVLVVDGALRELVIAAGDAQIERTRIEDDLVLAAGDATVSSDSRITGSVILTAGEVDFNAVVGGETWISGSEVTLGGQFAGDVNVKAEKLKISAGAVIRGNLIHSAESVSIDPGAQITGKTTALEPEKAWRHGPGLLGVFAGVLSLAGILLIPSIIVTAFPTRSRAARDQIRSRPWETLGIGILATLFTPIALALLFVSVVGGPLGLVALPFLTAAAIVAWSASVYTIGDWFRELRGASDTRAGRFIWTAVGSIVILVLLAVPFLNVLVWLAVFFAGWGALMETMRARKLP